MGQKHGKGRAQEGGGREDKNSVQVQPQAQRPVEASRRPSAQPHQQPLERRPSTHQQPLERRPSTQPDGPVMIRRGSSQQQAEELNVYAKTTRTTPHGSVVAGMHRHGSSQDALRRPSKTTTPDPTMGGEDMPQQRRTLFDHLVAFYFRNDHERLMNGDVDVDGICDWALSGGPDGIAALNERLRDKYEEDLDTFLINAAMPESDEEEDEEGEGKEDESDDIFVGDVPPPSPPGSREASSELSHAAALERPAIPAARRRPTNNAAARFKVDENGQLLVPESEQLDHQPAVDLETQLRQFIESIDPARVHEVPRFLKLANDNGLIALNSELLVSFGKDLKGNTLDDGSQQPDAASGESNARKFGIGFDNKVLAEMQNHKLNHEDSGRVLLHADPETGACSRFRLDTESPVFGMCKCGHERAAHIKRASVVRSGTLERKLAQRRASINVDAIKEQQAKSPSVVEEAVVTPSAGKGGGAQGSTTFAKPPTPSVMNQKPPTVASATTSTTTATVKPPAPAGSKPPAPTNPSPLNTKPTSPTSPKPPAPTNALRQPSTTTNVPSPTVIKPPTPPPASNATSPKPPAPTGIKPPAPNTAVSPKSLAPSSGGKPPTPSSSSSAKAQPAWVKPQQQPLQTSSTSTAKPPRPKSTRRPKSVRKGPPPTDSTLERLTPGEKKPVPCAAETFQLDMSANEFGTCAGCGWKKSEHVSGGGGKEASSKASTLEIAPSKRPVSLRKDGPPEPCNNYKLDLTADTFGACVCGFARQAHKGQGSNTQVISKTLEKRWNEVKSIA